MNEERVERCKTDLAQFCREYLPEYFSEPWTEEQIGVVRRLEEIILHGGRTARLMRRGSGKTTILTAAQLWAYVFWHRRFSLLITAGDSEHKRGVIYDGLGMDGMPRVREDFGDLIEASCHDGPRRYAWWIPVFESKKGLCFPDGEDAWLRPDLLLIDNPETIEDSWSPSRKEELERILSREVLALGIIGVDIAGAMLGTAEDPESVMFRMADEKRHPEWEV